MTLFLKQTDFVTPCRFKQKLTV